MLARGSCCTGFISIIEVVGLALSIGHCRCFAQRLREVIKKII